MQPRDPRQINSLSWVTMNQDMVTQNVTQLKKFPKYIIIIKIGLKGDNNENNRNLYILLYK